MSFLIQINGTNYKVNSTLNPVTSSLNTFIRETAQLKGTKVMCREGGCGACIVTVKELNPNTKKMESKSVNSCLFPLYRCIGSEITTIEGLGSVKSGLHPIQERLQHFHGTQCGYCSPGMIMTMHGLMESKNGSVSMAEVEDSLSGNHCRCTGYRPILDAFKSLAVDTGGKYVEMCEDIEDIGDFVQICPTLVTKLKIKDGNNCLKLDQLSVFKNEEKIWCNVYSVKEVFATLKEIGNKSYMLVAGNTAHGVYRREHDIEVFINISTVDSLRSHSIGNQIKIGGCVTLTEMIDILKEAAKTSRFYSYCNQIVTHLELVANVPVRNAGTIAGNLMIKYQHHDFPSDLFLLLTTCGATITIADSKLVNNQYTVVDFLRTSMRKKLILNITMPQIDSNEYTFRSYKIARRAQNAHADVNAGFLSQYKNGLIESIRICYGGINKNFIHAANTEKLLIDKDIYSDEVLQTALLSLNSEINPTWIEPQTSVEHRKGVAIALFYKFVLNTCPASRMKPEYMTGGQLLKRPLSSGQQSFETVEKNWPLTKPIPKVEAQYQCTGEAEYVNDLPNLPRELFVALVVATKVGYNIAQIDASEALAIPGVVAFYSAKDIPGENNFANSKLFLLQDVEEIFCSGEVLYHSQPAGIILADTFEKAHYATNKVKIMYYKNDKTSEDNGLKNLLFAFASSLFSKTTGHRKGTDKIIPTIKELDKDTVKYAKNSKFEAIIEGSQKIKGYLKMYGQYHYTMETLSTVCVPSDQGLQVYTATQWPDAVHAIVAKAINQLECSVTVHVKPLGGGFGGKISRTNFSAAVCAIGAVLSNTPVRFVMTIEENMTTVGKRCGSNSYYDVDFQDDGKILKVDNYYVSDGGCSRNENISIFIADFYGNCYDRSVWPSVGESVITQSASNTWCRAPGSLEAIAMTENIIEHVAWTLKKDPVDVRMTNIPADNRFKELIPSFLQKVDYHARREEINEFNVGNRWLKRGIGICPMQYLFDVHYTRTAQVNIYHVDGSVIVTHGAVEMGQGLNTRVAQVAAHTLGVPFDVVRVKQINTINLPNCFINGGNFGMDSAIFATLKACEILNQRLQPIKTEMPNSKFSDIAHAAHEKLIDLSARFTADQTQFIPYLCYGLSCAEIELDVLTGKFEIRRVDILEDTGESLNPALDIGQIEGAYVMGLGYWLTEELVYDRETGKLLTDRTWNYKIPGAKDIPIDFRINLLQKTANPLFVLKSKVVGEAPIDMAINSIFALRHALNSARKDADEEEWYHLGAPTTNETIFLTTKNKLEDYKLLS